jgi:DNA-binding MltR family transcriptional regulator
MARSSARKLLDELPSAEEMTAVVANLKLMDDAAVALVGTAYLDHALEIILKSQFRRLTASEEKRLFDGSQNAILGALSAKIRIAYAMFVINVEIYGDLLLINDIRNAFAHSLRKDVFFTNPLIISDCKKLKSLYVSGRTTWLPGEHPEPIHLFIETVQYLYELLKNIADRFEQGRRVYNHVMAQAASAQSPVEPTPSRRKSPRPSHRSRPTPK